MNTTAKSATMTPLAKAADDDDLVARGQPCPQVQRRAVGRLRAGLGLGPAPEDVAAGDQLRQDDDAGAPPGGVRDGVGGGAGRFCRRVAEHRVELAAGHNCRIHGIDLLALSFTPDLRLPPIWAGTARAGDDGHP